MMDLSSLPSPPHIAHFSSHLATFIATETMDDLSAASLLGTIEDVNQWTVEHFFLELYSSADDAAKPVNVDLVKWLKRDGHKKHHSSADQVFFRIFRPNSFFRIFRKIGLSCLGNYL